jgi:hypothetical protein
MADAIQTFMAKYNVAGSYDANDPLTPIYINLTALYANKAQFANNPARSNATLIEASLRAKQILYYKKTPGDCASTTKVGGALQPLQTGAKIGLTAAGTLTSLATAGVFGGAAGATGVAAEVSSVAVSGAFAAATAGIGLALVPVFAILAHHQAAVAKEQADLCEVTGFVNSGFASVRDANVDWMTKKNYFNQIAQQGISAAGAVTQKGPNTCNAGCMISQAILALRDLYIQLYGQPPSSTLVDGPQTQGSGPTATNAQGGASTLGTAGGIATVAGAATLAHYAGLF